MRDPSATPALLGVLGHPLRLPPLGHGIALSFCRWLWLIAILVLGVGPGLLIWTLELPSAREIAVAWWIGFTVSAGKLGTQAVRLWKHRFLMDRFWIVTLRPFHHAPTSSLFRHLVAPTLGCYGAVNVVGDESFERSARKVDDATLDFQPLGDAHLASRFSEEEWKDKVTALIALSDVAVIDLTLPSENLVWETGICLQLLPPHRIFFTLVDGAPWGDRLELLRACLADHLPGDTFARAAARVRPIHYGGFFFMTWRLRWRIFRAMRRIERQDREVAAAGTWRPPGRRAGPGQGAAP